MRKLFSSQNSARKFATRPKITARIPSHPMANPKQKLQAARTCFLRQGDPVAADAVALDVAPQLLVLLRRPGPPLHARLVAARRAPHVRGSRETTDDDQFQFYRPGAHRHRAAAYMLQSSEQIASLT